ncbi:MAG: hypothetical protein ACE5PM_02585 [Candidatus Hydrothermarchaeales archaeon]
MLTKKQAKILKMNLESSGLTQSEVAKRLGIVQPEFSRLLQGAKKNAKKAEETIKFMKEIGYFEGTTEKVDITSPPQRRHITYAKQMIWNNTTGGDLSIEERTVRNTLVSNYLMTKLKRSTV